MLHYASSHPLSPPHAVASSDDLIASIAGVEPAIAVLPSEGSPGPSYRCVQQGYVQDEGGLEGKSLWEAIGLNGQSYGFLGLVQVKSQGVLNETFGPFLTVMLKRKLAPRLASGLIANLMAELKARKACRVVHASHAPEDGQLANWLEAAGFLYTGCRDGDGAREMVLVL